MTDDAALRLQRIIDESRLIGRLSPEDQAAYDIARIGDPDSHPGELLRTLSLTRTKASRGWFRARLSQLVRRRNASGRPLDPDSDPELAKAAAQAAAEELSTLVPGAPLHDEYADTALAGRFTAPDERRYHRQMAVKRHFDDREEERAEAEQRSRERLRQSKLAELDRLERYRGWALAAEDRENKRAIADILRGLR